MLLLLVIFFFNSSIALLFFLLRPSMFIDIAPSLLFLWLSLSISICLLVWIVETPRAQTT